MGEMVASALAQEGVSKMSSYMSTKINDKASRAHNLARLEIALSRLEFVLEKTRKMPITYISLIRSRNMFCRAYREGVHLLNKHKLQALEGHEETSQQVVVRRGSSSSYLQLIARASRLFSFSISSLVGLECLSSSHVQIFESYADGAEKFVTNVESVCPLRRDTFFPYPFVRQLLEGKILKYERIQGRQRFTFNIRPLVWEGRGVEAELLCKCFDPGRPDKSFSLQLMLRLSETTDIIGTAIDCMRSSASLQNLVASDAIIRELALLSNLQDNISSSYCYDYIKDAWHALFSRSYRPEPLCCQANGHVKSTISLEPLQNFQEQIICFSFSCGIQALEYSLPSASDEAGRNVMPDQPPLMLLVFFAPHSCSLEDGRVTEAIVGGKQKFEECRPLGNIQQTENMVRSRSVDCLINQPETSKYCVDWKSRHGRAYFEVEKPRAARGRYNTRSAGKRKRP